MTLEESFSTCPRMEKGEYHYLVHPLLDGTPRVDPSLLQAWVEWAKVQPALERATVLLAPEAMAIPLAVALSIETGIPYLVARKRAYDHSPGFQMTANTGYSTSTYHVHDVDEMDNVVLIDDVVSTGGTLHALQTQLGEAGIHLEGTLVLLDKIPEGDRVPCSYTAMVAGRMQGSQFLPES